MTVTFDKGTYLLRPADAERVEVLIQGGFGIAAQNLAAQCHVGPRGSAPPFRVQQGFNLDD